MFNMCINYISKLLNDLVLVSKWLHLHKIAYKCDNYMKQNSCDKNYKTAPKYFYCNDLISYKCKYWCNII